MPNETQIELEKLFFLIEANDRSKIHKNVKILKSYLDNSFNPKWEFVDKFHKIIIAIGTVQWRWNSGVGKVVRNGIEILNEIIFGDWKSHFEIMRLLLCKLKKQHSAQTIFNSFCFEMHYNVVPNFRMSTLIFLQTR